MAPAKSTKPKPAATATAAAAEWNHWSRERW